MPVEARVQPADGEKANASALILMRSVAGCLNKHYPGYMWMLNIDVRGGVVDIQNLDISSRYGYREYLSIVQEDIGLKSIIRGAGEMLERAKLDRGTYTHGATHIEGVKDSLQPMHGKII